MLDYAILLSNYDMSNFSHTFIAESGVAKSFLAVSGVPSADEPAFSRLGLGRVVPIGLGSADAEPKDGSSTLPGFSRLGLGRVDGGTTGPGTSSRGFSDELSPPSTTDTTSSSSCSSWPTCPLLVLTTCSLVKSGLKSSPQATSLLNFLTKAFTPVATSLSSSMAGGC